MDIDIAMAGIEGLIKLAIEVARAIGQAIDEANELMQQLPLVRSGVATVKTNLGATPLRSPASRQRRRYGSRTLH